MTAADDFYRVLRVPPDASGEEIHRAYRMLAREHHPDRGPDPERARRMARINEAYAHLSDPVRRHAYDRSLRVLEPPEFQAAVCAAATEILAKAPWRRLDAGPEDRLLEIDQLLEKGRFRVALRFETVLGPDELERWGRSLDALFRRERADCGVAIAFRVLAPEAVRWRTETLRKDAAALDLVEARLFGDPLPPPCAGLLRPFLLD